MRKPLQAASAALFLLFAAASLPAQNVSEQYLLAAANQDRAAHGLAPLKSDEHLLLAARLHAFQMAQHHDISHQFPNEQALAERAGDSGARFSLITENVAEASNSALIHDMWMNSAGHRANLLDPEVDSVGIAVVQQRGQLYAVEDFARTVTPLTLPQQEAAIASLLTAAGLTLAGSTPGNSQDARETCTLSTGYVGTRRPLFVMRFTTSSLDRLPAQLNSQLATGKYRVAAVGACVTGRQEPFTSYSLAVMLYP